LFSQLAHERRRIAKYEFKVSLLEIYNEQIKDLVESHDLKGDLKKLDVKNDPNGGTYVTELTTRKVECIEDVLQVTRVCVWLCVCVCMLFIECIEDVLHCVCSAVCVCVRVSMYTHTHTHTPQVMSVGMRNRSTSSTNMNCQSSRSHCIFSVHVTCTGATITYIYIYIYIYIIYVYAGCILCHCAIDHGTSHGPMIPILLHIYVYYVIVP
jgi:hypothetical protein